MAGNGGEKPEQIGEPKAQFQEEHASKNKLPNRHSLGARRIRRGAIFVLGVVGTILLGALRPEVTPPHDYWAAGSGVIALLGGIAVFLYDIGMPRTTAVTIFVALALGTVVTVDKWTRDFWMAQTLKPVPDTRQISPTPQFQPPRFEPAVTPYVLIDAGTVTTKLSRSNLAACPPYTPGSPYPFFPTFPLPLTLDGLDPISVCVDNNRVFVNVQLSDDRQPGSQAEIIHDHFTIEPMDWDWNFDDEAFEAVDGTQRPVLQLIYRSPSDILIHGVFIADGVAAVLADEGSTENFPLKNLPSVRARPDRQIKRIFKYPHEKYLHIRE